MFFLTVMAAVALLDGPNSAVSTVRANLDLMELAAERSYYIGSELDLLPPSYAPAILSKLPTIRHAAVMAMAGRWFVKNHYPSAIPSLIQSFDKRFLTNKDTQFPPAASAVTAFAADAVPYLLQTCRQGSANQIAVCAGLLANFCVNKPADARVIRLMVDLNTGPDPRLRRVALQGIWNAAVIFHDWNMDDIHTVEIFRPELIRYVIDAACASDKETAELAKRYLFRLVWQDDMRLGPRPGPTGSPVPNLAPKMFDQVLNSKLPEVRAAAVVLESANDGLDLVRLKALSDPDPLVFHAAVASSRVLIGLGWQPHLIKLASSTNAQERRAAALLLVASFDAAAKPTLRKLATDADPDIRLAARCDW